MTAHVLNELEVLEAAYATLNGRDPLVVIDEGSWDFADWTRCTCGHIYGGALGIHPRNLDTDALDSPTAAPWAFLENGEAAEVTAQERAYLAALNAVLDANYAERNADDDVPQQALHVLVSNLTVDHAGGIPEGESGADEAALLLSARELVGNAITYLKDKYEEDRKRVAG